MTSRVRLRRVAGAVVAVVVVIVTGGVASASSQPDLAVALAGVERGLEAASHQGGAATGDPRIAQAVAAVEMLVAERLRTDPALDIDDVLSSLVEDVPTGLDSDLGDLLDDVKVTGRELAEQKRAEAPGQTGTVGKGNAGGNGNAGGKGNAGGNGSTGDKGNAGGNGSAAGKGNAGGNGKGPPEG